jgi:hypothetical protein
MGNNKVGLFALVLALGAAAEAGEVKKSPEAKHIDQLNSVKELVNQLETSNDINEYEAKLTKIKNMLDTMTSEEVKKMKNASPPCATESKSVTE